MGADDEKSNDVQMPIADSGSGQVISPSVVDDTAQLAKIVGEGLKDAAAVLPLQTDDKEGEDNDDELWDDLNNALYQSWSDKDFQFDTFKPSLAKVIANNADEIFSKHYGIAHPKILSVKVAYLNSGYDYVVFRMTCEVAGGDGDKKNIVLAATAARNPRFNSFITTDYERLNEIAAAVPDSMKSSILHFYCSQDGDDTTPAINIAPFMDNASGIAIKIDSSSQDDKSNISKADPAQIQSALLKHQLGIVNATGIPLFPSNNYRDYLLDLSSNKLVLTRYRDPRLYHGVAEKFPTYWTTPARGLGPDCRNRAEAIAYQLLHILYQYGFTYGTRIKIGSGAPAFLANFIYSTDEIGQAVLAEFKDKISPAEKSEIIGILKKKAQEHPIVKVTEHHQKDLAFSDRVVQFCVFFKERL